MPAHLIGTKVGMTRVFDELGASIPVTVIQIGPCIVTQIRTPETDGYSAVQVGFGEMKARNSTIPMIGHDAKAGTTPKRVHEEFEADEKEAAAFTLGQAIGLEIFEGQKYVDVSGISKGKGFQGTMKRHHFKGLFASHGTERKHRSPGSIGSHCSNRGFGGGLKKGKKMSGHMGAENVTCRSLDVVRIDKENGLLLVKGPIPGANRGIVTVRAAVRLNRSKTKKLSLAAAAAKA